MLRIYFVLAWRNLWKNKLFTFINLAGLSLAIGFLFLVGAYCWSELNVNNGIKDKERLYHVQSKWKVAGMGLEFTTLAPIGKTLQENYPNLVESYYHHDGINSIISRGNKHFKESLQPGDNHFFNVTGFPVLHGNAATAFNKPNAIVLTVQKAIKFFGRTDVVGETLTVKSFSGNQRDFEITAVLKDLPYNTITNFNNGSNEFFLPEESLAFFGRDAGFNAWQNPYIINYVKLREGIKPADLAKPVKEILALNAPVETQKNLELYFTPVNKYYLQSNNGIIKKMMLALAAISLFILIMAVVNFINTTTGNTLTRIREMGVRKVMGSTRIQLITQFLTETVLQVFIAVIFSVVLYIFTASYFGTLMNKEIPRFSDLPLGFIWIFPVLSLVIGLIAGLYPATVLTAQPAVTAIRGKLKNLREKRGLRYALISVQFITAIIVFISTIYIHKQISFFLNTDLGFQKDGIITATVPRDWTQAGVQKMEAIRNRFLQMPEIQEASFSYEIPDGASGAENNTLFKASGDSSKGISTTSLFTDQNYLKTYNISLVAGRFFKPSGGVSDSTDIILNESAVKALGWTNPHEAIGEKLKVQGSQIEFNLAGIVKDFHFGSMQNTIRPIFFIHVKSALLYRYFSFKLKPGNLTSSISSVENKWNDIFPDAPFDFIFMDDTLKKLYSTEIRMKKASQMASIIGLIIVLLGVLGIISLSITKRKMEMGIRKILGANTTEVLSLFFREFVPILIISNLIAWPLAYLIMNKWLEQYAYRIPIGAGPFLLSGIMLIICVLLVTLLKTFALAKENPIKSLRSE
jgi:putative ABC transport system permease protein